MPFDSRIALNKLEIFCRVVELESVSRAARELYVSQPVVTAHMRSLQDRLGTRLLVREGHRMRTTEAGELVYEWARDILLRSYEMARRVEGLEDGTQGAVAIAASMTVGSYLLPRVLSHFSSERQSAQISVSVLDPEHAITAVESGSCDMAVVIASDELLTGHLSYELLASEQVILVAAPDSDPPSRIAAAQIARLRFVTAPRNLVREQLVERQLAEHGVVHGPTVMELGHAEAMKRAVREGIGVAFLMRASVAEDLAAGLLREIAVRNLPPLVAPVYLAYRDGRTFSPLQDALLRAIRAELGSATPDSAPAMARGRDSNLSP